MKNDEKGEVPRWAAADEVDLIFEFKCITWKWMIQYGKGAERTPCLETGEHTALHHHRDHFLMISIRITRVLLYPGTVVAVPAGGGDFVKSSSKNDHSVAPQALSKWAKKGAKRRN